MQECGTLETLEAMLTEAKAEAKRREAVAFEADGAFEIARAAIAVAQNRRHFADGLARIGLERVAALENAIAALRDLL